MAYQHMIVCDTCGKSEPNHPDDGEPAGWYLLAEIRGQGCWDVAWHFCSRACVSGPVVWGAGLDDPTL